MIRSSFYCKSVNIRQQQDTHYYYPGYELFIYKINMYQRTFFYDTDNYIVGPFVYCYSAGDIICRMLLPGGIKSKEVSGMFHGQDELKYPGTTILSAVILSPGFFYPCLLSGKIISRDCANRLACTGMETKERVED